MPPPCLSGAQAPLRIHIPLSAAALLLYGLMLHWGYNLLIRKPDPPSPPPSGSGTRAAVGSKDEGAAAEEVRLGRPLTPMEKASLASRALYASTVLSPKKDE